MNCEFSIMNSLATLINSSPYLPACLDVPWMYLESTFLLSTFFLPSSYPLFCISKKDNSYYYCSLPVAGLLPNIVCKVDGKSVEYKKHNYVKLGCVAHRH